MATIYEQRRIKLGERIPDGSLVLLSSGTEQHMSYDEFFPFEVNRNFYYLTGINEKEAYLLLMKTNNELTSYLFIVETTPFRKRWLGEMIDKEEASKISGIPESRIAYKDSFSAYFQSLMIYGRGGGVVPSYLYLDLFRVNKDSEPIAYQDFKELLSQYPELQVKDGNEHIAFLRMFKSKEEIAQIKKSIGYTKQGLNRILDNLKHRTNERQLEADFLHEITIQGSKGTSFHTISASGINATVLHYSANNCPLHDGELILFDLGAREGLYGSDITRTYPINGTYSPRQKELYEIVLDVNKKCIELVKPGVTWKTLNDKARDYLASHALRIGLIQEKDEIDAYYYHTIGHGLGLDIHDVGHYNIPLEAGMVLTIEPGLYIKEEGIGIRIEDDILVTETGAENLSKDIIKEVNEIEEYLTKR